MDEGERLIRQMRKGDDLAMEAFVRKYYPMILAYCGKRVDDPGMAEDLTQETFERFFRSFSSYQRRGKIKNYLYTIAGNLCRDLYGTKTAEVPMAEVDGALWSNGEWRRGWPAQEDNRLSYDPMADTIRELDIKRAVGQLPESCREMVILYCMYDLKQTEIAEILGVSIHIVKYRIRKGKKLLQKILKEEGFYEGAGTERGAHQKNGGSIKKGLL